MKTLMSVQKNIINTIGNTPLVELKKLNPNPKVRIFAKLEGQNPTGSLKDRIALYMLKEAEKSGQLETGQTVLEATSGNTGISLAFLCRLKGYKLTVVMPDNVTAERTQLIKAFGAEIIYSAGDKGTNGAIDMADEMGQKSQYFRVDQYSNPANVAAHYETTATEILEQVKEAPQGAGQVDYLVAGLGTGGTLMGVGKKLKEHNPNCRLIAIQPYPQGGLAGLRNLSEGFVPPILDLSLIDENIIVKDVEAYEATRNLLETEGIFAGVSSGAAALQAAKLASKTDGGTIVTIFPDNGWRYLSQGIWSKSPEEISKRYSGPLW